MSWKSFVSGARNSEAFPHSCIYPYRRSCGATSRSFCSLRRGCSQPQITSFPFCYPQARRGPCGSVCGPCGIVFGDRGDASPPRASCFFEDLRVNHSCPSLGARRVRLEAAGQVLSLSDLDGFDAVFSPRAHSSCCQGHVLIYLSSEASPRR